jgi:carbon storage regulator
MLVLSRKISERILISDNITITVVRIGPNSVRIGIDAPSEMNIKRTEAETNEDNGQCTT